MKCLRFLLVAAAACVLAASCLARDYKIGPALYTVRDACAKDFEGTVAEVGRMGFTGVEFAGFYGRTADQIKAMLKADHLAVYGAHIQLDELLGDKFKATAEFNQAIGNPLIVVPWIPDERRNTKEALIKTAHLFEEIAAKLKPYHIMLGYHNHMVEFQPVEGELPWDTFFGNSDSSVKVQFDTGNAMTAGVQAAPFLRKYPARLISVHVKDFSKTNHNALLGEGDVDWQQVIPILKSKDGPRYLIIEQEVYPEPSLVCAKKCLNTLRKMLGLRVQG